MFKEELRAFLAERMKMEIDSALEDFPNWKVSDKTAEDLDDLMDNFGTKINSILLNDYWCIDCWNKHIQEKGENHGN